MSTDRRDEYEDDDRPARRERAHYEEAHRGGLILALGIISLTACQPVGIFAWVMGNNDLRAMEEGRMDPEGKQLTQIGKILGIVGSILFALSMVFMVLYFVGIALFLGLR
jgi:hypothetical protein